MIILDQCILDNSPENSWRMYWKFIVKRTWYSPGVYVFPVCFQVLLMDTWNIELPVKEFKQRSVRKCVCYDSQVGIQHKCEGWFAQEDRPTLNVLGQCVGRDLCWTDMGIQRQTLKLDFLLHQAMMRGSVRLCSTSPYLKNRGTSCRYQ